MLIAKRRETFFLTEMKNGGDYSLLVKGEREILVLPSYEGSNCRIFLFSLLKIRSWPFVIE